MANICLAWGNRVDSATLSGGDYETAFPRGNLSTLTSYADVARTTDASTTATKVLLDHGSAVDLRTLAIVAHNLSADAQIRISHGSTSGGSEVYAGAWRYAWLFEPSGGANGKRHAVIDILTATVSARYTAVEIDDTTNADGYVEFKLFIGASVMIPAINAQYGLQDTLTDLSGRDRSDSGVLWVTARRTLRGVSFVMPALTQDEGAELHEMQRVCGSAQPVLYAPEAANTADVQRYGFLGSIDELQPLEYPRYRTRGIGFRITER